VPLAADPPDTADPSDTADPFDTVALRTRVLDAWTASPARFREDANAEDDLVRGSYRDRVIVELAQNAADAAARAGEPGRLRLRLTDRELVASNTGSPLDAAGAESLSTLRASAKRHSADSDRAPSGRFGVGFAAVLAVTDEPRLASTSGAVRWSSTAAREAVVAVPALADELARRHGQLPILRLPLAATDLPEDGFATTVTLRLRDADAAALVQRLLAEVDDALLLALPDLAQIEVVTEDTSRVVADAARWDVVRRSGPLDVALLVDRPVEERDRPWWSLTWARPVAGQPVPPTVHAPTPTDEPLELPALLIASFPLDPGRRHVAPGPLTDFLVAQAGEAYAELAARAEDPLDLVPAPVAVGSLDGALRAAALGALTRAPLLRTASGDRVHPGDAVVVVGADEEVRAVLADVLPGLVADHPALGRLGVRRLPMAEVVDLLATVDREPGWWHRLYAALSGRASGLLESLGSLPVPLADGRTVRGPRGLLLPGDGGLPDGLEPLGLRVVHSAAAHPLLLRLGAVEATSVVVLDQPEVRAAVENAWDHESPSALADAVLALVERAGTRPGERPWLGELLLPDDRGELAAARELVLPGSLLDRVADPESVGRPGPELLERWGPDVLAAAGVLANLSVLRAEDVLLDASAEDDVHDLDDESGWVRSLRALLPPDELAVVAPEMLAVRDLDLVRDDAWDVVLSALAGDRELRRAVVEPTLLVTGNGGRVAAPSYTAWWLRVYARLDGLPPTSFAAAAAGAGAGDLHGLYDPAPASLASLGVDDALLEAIGVRTSVSSLLASPGGASELLDRLADPSRVVDGAALARLYAALSEGDPEAVDPPDRVRVRADLVVDADDALVLDAPHHLQLSWPAPPLVVSLAAVAAVAAALDLETTGSRLGTVQVRGGELRSTPDVAREVLPDAPADWVEHDELTVAGQPVDWWLGDDGRVHACTVDGLARGLAWSAGRWDLRLLLAAALETPSRLRELLAEAGL
jgi:hypothetical protein